MHDNKQLNNNEYVFPKLNCYVNVYFVCGFSSGEENATQYKFNIL